MDNISRSTSFPRAKMENHFNLHVSFSQLVKKKYDIKKKSLLLLGKTNQSINEIKFLISIY